MSNAGRPPENDLLKRVPAVAVLLEVPELAADAAVPGARGTVTDAIRAELDALRRRLLTKSADAADLDPAVIAGRVRKRLARDFRPLPRMINATGVILHSGLGRAPLPEAAMRALSAMGHYHLLEVDREKGDRRARDTRCSAMLQALTGAEAALVVNNCAAATVLMLQAVAQGREVVCSRGEMVEIGGSFRIPEVMEASGCRLVSVGATNRTRAEDYEAAIGPSTAAFLVVHTSNYRVVGFTGSPSLADLVRIGAKHGIPVMHDLGSGSILGPEELGVGDEPPASASIAAGADLVCMSGDKLLGGPQAGIILGKKAWVDRCRRAPMARAMRIDKLRIAALEATLELFLDRKTLDATHPVTAMVRATPETLRPRAESMARALRASCPAETRIDVVASEAEAGSGALPALPIPSLAVTVSHPRTSADALSRALRDVPVGVFSVIRDGRVQLDARTVADDDVATLAASVAEAFENLFRAP